MIGLIKLTVCAKKLVLDFYLFQPLTFFFLYNPEQYFKYNIIVTHIDTAMNIFIVL